MRLKNNSLPTLLQIRYLTELTQTEGMNSGMIMQVARKCESNHGAVSRYFKTCMENGILTEDYQLTTAGQSWLSGYQGIVRELETYLKSLGLTEAEVKNSAGAMVENIEPHTLKLIIGGRRGDLAIRKKDDVHQKLADSLTGGGDCRVNFRFYRTEGDYSQSRESMANRGFEPKAYLRRIDGEDYLVLTVCEMSARSRVDGTVKKGTIRSLKYSDSGVLRKVEITEGMEQLCLPLYAFRMQQTPSGIAAGFLLVTVTCSVGLAHMPESTAMLVFWV